MGKPNAILTIDTREQRPYALERFTSKHVAFDIRYAALPAGDYAAKLHECDGPAATCIIERKTHTDLLSTLTRGRARFKRELKRLQAYGFRAVVVEADLPSIARGLPTSKVSPAAVIASLVAFAQRYGVHVAFASDRRHAEVYVFRLLERWVQDRWEEVLPGTPLPDDANEGNGNG